MATVRLTMAQALVRYLVAQRIATEEGSEPLFGGVWAIFGHGNVAGLGEALYAVRDRLPTLRAHNEQGMALAATAYAKANFRRRMMAVTTSIGPGCTTLAVIAREPKSRAKPLVKPTSPALLIAYRLTPGNGARSTRQLPTLTMRPPARKCGAAARVAATVAMRWTSTN